MYQNSFFEEQHANLNEQNSKFNSHIRYINIDSSKRIKHNSLSTTKIETIDNFVKITDNQLFVIIIDPYQLSNKQEKILDNITIIFKWISHNNSNAPISINNINSSTLIYDEKQGNPYFSAILKNYDEDTDRAYYLVQGIVPSKSSNFQLYFNNGYLELRLVEEITEGYPNSNYYKLYLENSYKNVKSLRVISSIFPVPCLKYDNIINRCYTIHFHIPGIIDKHSLLLNINSCKSLSDILNELCTRINCITSNYNLTPLLHFEKFFSLYLLKYQLSEKYITNIVSDKDSISIVTGKDIEVPPGTLVWININENKGIYRSVPRFSYLINYTSNQNNEKLPNLFTSMNSTTSFSGIIYKINIEKNLIEITSNTNISLEPGDILYSSNKRFSVTVNNCVLLGNSIYPWFKKCISSPIFQYQPREKGLYFFSYYKINYNEGNILYPYNIKNVGKITQSITNRPDEYLVKAELSSDGKLSSKLTISNNNLPPSELYQVSQIITENKRAFDTTIEEIIAIDEDEHQKLRIFLRDNKYLDTINRGDKIKISFKDHSEYIEVDKINREQLNLVTTRNLEQNDEPLHLRKPIIDLSIKNNSPLPEIITFLEKDILRDENKIYTTEEVFTEGFIIQFSICEDGKNVTNSELNVIEEINDNEIKLRYPVANSWLSGTKIIQKYLYLEIKEINSNYLIVDSDLELDTIDNCLGIINWLSVLVYDEKDKDEFIYEEYIDIINIENIGHNQYQLFSRNIINTYPNEEMFIALLISPDLISYPTSTHNYRQDEKWYTKILLEKNVNSIVDLQIGKPIFIYGGLGENCPIYGLLDSDHIARQFTNREIDLSQEYLSDLVTDIDSRNEHEIIHFDMDNEEPYIVIEGRYMGRKGSIRILKNGESSSLNLNFDEIYLSSNGNQSFTYINRDVFGKLPDGKYWLKVRAFNNLSLDNEFSQIYHQKYFYLCSNLDGVIDNIPTKTNFVDIEKPRNVNYYRETSELKYLNNIMSKIVLNNKKSDEQYVFDSCSKLPLTYKNNPIKELTELTFVFLWDDGRLVDFQNKDHSFILEITQEDSFLEVINPRTGHIR